jgi:ferredoxin
MGCGACVRQCPFGAIHRDEASGKPHVHLDDCYGCGVCRHVCPTDALFLVPRDLVPALAGKY